MGQGRCPLWPPADPKRLSMKPRVSDSARPLEARHFTRLNFGRGNADCRRRRGVRACSGTRVLAQGATAAECTVLACLGGEGRETGGGCSCILSGEEETAVGGSLFIGGLHGNVGNAREQEGKKERYK